MYTVHVRTHVHVVIGVGLMSMCVLQVASLKEKIEAEQGPAFPAGGLKLIYAGWLHVHVHAHCYMERNVHRSCLST